MGTAWVNHGRHARPPARDLGRSPCVVAAVALSGSGKTSKVARRRGQGSTDRGPASATTVIVAEALMVPGWGARVATDNGRMQLPSHGRCNILHRRVSTLA